MRHCAVNVSLYGAGGRRWTMTERDATAVRRTARTLTIGASALHWDGSSLVIDIDEVTAPIPRRVRGTVRVHPMALGDRGFVLDAAGRHRWRPIAACARIEAAFESPALRWSGPAYFDTNDGDAPLESDFLDWDWCRAPLRDATAILYNARRADGTDQSLALRFGRDGRIDPFDPPPPVTMRRTLWRMPRPTRAEGGAARVTETLQDAPFYSRSVIATRLLGQDATAVHESLDLRRFAARPVQMMLPFRVPRSIF
jgi:carotenoid 1,2-hydratase